MLPGIDRNVIIVDRIVIYDIIRNKSIFSKRSTNNIFNANITAKLERIDQSVFLKFLRLNKNKSGKTIIGRIIKIKEIFISLKLSIFISVGK